MSDHEKEKSEECQVCGGKAKYDINNKHILICQFCGFRKLTTGSDLTNSDLVTAENINSYFRSLYNSMDHHETVPLQVPVNRIYKSPKPLPGQVNFFKSKNIMFLLEQHGFQMVSRRSRFFTELNLIIRKV